jgi:hypothetical protein
MLFLMLFTVSFFSCTTVCESPLTAASSLQEIQNTCTFPENLDEYWNCETNVFADDINSRAKLYDNCSLGMFGKRNEFLFASNNAVEAVKKHAFLKSKVVEGADTIVPILLGDSIYPTDFSYIEMKRGLSEKLSSKTFALRVDNISQEGSWGEFPLWHISNLPSEQYIAVTAAVNIKTIRHMLASLPEKYDSMHLIFQDTDLYQVTIHQPSASKDVVSVEWKDGAFSSFPVDTKKIRVQIANDQSVGSLLTLATSTMASIELDLQYKPCLTSPSGMKCIEGRNGIDTFYIDTSVVKSCASGKKCRSTKGSWDYAREVCVSHGKRLPSIYEMELSPVSELVWTSTWQGKREPPYGHCSDQDFCYGVVNKLLSNGHPHHKSKSLVPNMPIYCASDYPHLVGEQPYMIASSIKDPATLVADLELAKVASENIRHDDLTDKGICGEDIRGTWIEKLRYGGRSTTSCRDPFSYVTSNEPKRYLWAPYLRNVGGGYAGVGSDQNYDFVALAKSEWVWLYDYDPNVFRLHQMLKPLILSAENAEDFVALFTEKSISKAHKLIDGHYNKETLTSKKLKAFYSGYRNKLYNHYKKSLKRKTKYEDFGWLAVPSNYAYIRLLHSQDRIIPVAGDMLAQNGLRSIGETATKMKVPLRIYYTSNAPTAWGGQITPDYAKNVASFPFDDRSIVLTTYNSGVSKKFYWHFSVANAQVMQRRITSGDYTNKQLIWDCPAKNQYEVAACKIPSKIAGL